MAIPDRQAPEERLRQIGFVLQNDPCMSQIIVFAQLKGGVGKTTLAVAVAAELAERGFSVGLIDPDPQGSAGQWASPGQLPCKVYAMPLGDTPIQNWIRAARTIAADYVVIDTAPDASTMIAPIALANITVVPCTPSGLDIRLSERAAKAAHRGGPGCGHELLEFMGGICRHVPAYPRGILGTRERQSGAETAHAGGCQRSGRSWHPR